MRGELEEEIVGREDRRTSRLVGSREKSSIFEKPGYSCFRRQNSW
jgi:hypothetical protein